MKKLFLVAVSFFLLMYGCTKDTIEDGNDTLKSSISTSNAIAQNTLMRVWFISSPDFTLPKVQVAPEGYSSEFLPGGGWMSGHSNITKIIDPENSKFVFTSCIQGPESEQSTSTLEGTITCQQFGCSYYYTANIITDFRNMTFSGSLTIGGGTGHYKGLIKTLDLKGTINPETGEYTWIGVENMTPQN